MIQGVVAIVGRANVGKSTIFNRIVGERVSIVEDTPGVTRDRIYANATWLTRSFRIIDTGGIELENASFTEQISAQAQIAIEEADVIIFVVNGREGIRHEDTFVAKMLQKSKKPVILAVNKIDDQAFKNDIYEFYNLGIGDPIAVSGSHGIGIGDVLDQVIHLLPAVSEPEEHDDIRFSIIGRPNVGKSSLTNALLGEERVIVSDIEGTTRDAIDTKFEKDGQKYCVVDTAGMRKKGRIYESVEKYSLIRSLKAIERSDVCVVVIDASTGIIEHDKHIISYAIEAGKGIVIAVNKWDTVKNPDGAIKDWKELIKYEFQFVPYAKEVFLSALTKKRINTLMPEVISAYENNKKEVKTSVLNNIIMEAVSIHIPPSYKGKRLKIYFVSQTDSKPPKFTLQVNDKKLVHFSYERYLENKIRDIIDLTGTPIILQFKNKGED